MSNQLKGESDVSASYRYDPAPRGAMERQVPLTAGDDADLTRTSLHLAPLGGVLENMNHGVVLLASDSYPCYTNSAAEELLLADGERGLLARELQTVSRAVLDGARAEPREVEVTTKVGRYRMRATLLLEKIKEISSRAVMVTIERADSSVPSRELLMKRHVMTRREAEITLFLARGMRNAAIAAELEISPHTARHHTENILAKLNVHTRAEVARAISDSFGTGQRAG